MTPEREKEIRAQQETGDGCFEIEELLAEIDRLKSELMEASGYIEEQDVKNQRERDQLKENLALAEEALRLIITEYGKPGYKDGTVDSHSLKVRYDINELP